METQRGWPGTGLMITLLKCIPRVTLRQPQNATTSWPKMRTSPLSISPLPQHQSLSHIHKWPNKENIAHGGPHWLGVERLSFQKIEITAIWIPGRTKVNSKKRKYRKMKARKQTWSWYISKTFRLDIPPASSVTNWWKNSNYRYSRHEVLLLEGLFSSLSNLNSGTLTRLR